MGQNTKLQKESVHCTVQHTVPLKKAVGVKPTAKDNSVPRMTGIVVPLGALKSKSCPIVGEYTVLPLFASWCKKAGLSIIQILPVNDTGTQSSPYSGLSAFALHPVYITIPQIPEFKSLYTSDKKFAALYNSFITNHKDDERWNYEQVRNEKDTMLRALYEEAAKKTDSAIEKILAPFIKANSWIPAYCVYKNLKWTNLQSSWKSWSKNDRDSSKEKIINLWNDKPLRHAHLFYAWEQFIAFNQFYESAEKIRALGITLKGDLPILMNDDSCDVWSKPELFSIKNRAGSPPDGDNPTGQNWGFPTYNWAAHEKDGFSWWKERLATASRFYGAYRLDHILGFFRIWAVPEHNTTAILGHTEPYCSITREELTEAGFSKDRIHWMSEPHIPTSALTDAGLSISKAHAMLEKICNRLGREELWNFKAEINSDGDIVSALSSEETPADNAPAMQDSTSDSPSNNAFAVQDVARAASIIAPWWNNRLLIEITKDHFIPSWLHESTQAWKSLSDGEKEILNKIFYDLENTSESKWESHAQKILSALTSSTAMIPCGENLGVNLSCVPSVLAENTILSLNVVRWTRRWAEEGQPYIPFEEYKPLSVTTTSVHDSSTMRQWWNEEKDSAFAFEKSAVKNTDKPQPDKKEPVYFADAEFTPKTALFILSHAAKTASTLFINPLQDWLYLNTQYWRTDEKDERINVPGTVSPFNWTYRIPKDIETIDADKALAASIAAIASIHDKSFKQQTAAKSQASAKDTATIKTGRAK